MNPINRIYVEKQQGFDVESQYLYREFKETLGISQIEKVRSVRRYDFQIENREMVNRIITLILSEPNVDITYEQFVVNKDEKVFAIEYLPGQYSQRADSASQCIQIMTQDMNVLVNASTLIIIQGQLTDDELHQIKNYCINPVDSREASMEMPNAMKEEVFLPMRVEILHGFIHYEDDDLFNYREKMGFAMSDNDIISVRNYFCNNEKRDPTITELKVIDTYWSDHCRHTTFLTEIQKINFEEGFYKEYFESVLMDYLKSREELGITKPITLMDIATVNIKVAKAKGLLTNLDESEEINACSIEIDVDVDGVIEEWLLMFKNETHNHPTEIEPFGGAATCLGGAIRDPLSGRSFVYQAMRITGSGDPRNAIEETIPGKLPQRKITREAAKGFSSYGNQIGLATGKVVEIYHEGYVAKRMEIGAVIGAVKKDHVLRTSPKPGDVILVIGGKTGRDGCGGATGSSKAHTQESLARCGAEVQKGNPTEERKLQRLFRNPKFTKLVKKCNDFGAGGVAVAIGELARSLEIELDAIPKKYEGLDGTELAISESQERMAVVVRSEHEEQVIAYAREENLLATKVARVTENERLVMKWQGESILDIHRDFLDTNGAKQFTEVTIKSPQARYEEIPQVNSFQELWKNTLEDLNVCSQRGLEEMFDSTIGSGSVLMPYGGKYALTPTEGMVAKIPVLDGESSTCSMMSYGYTPHLSQWSPFHGGIYAVVESVAKIVAMGGDYRSIRLSMQEYFERLGEDPVKWGKPFSALLGAYHVQKALGLAAIGGKDSMSGSFHEIEVPPTIVSFAVAVDHTKNILSPEFQYPDSKVYLIHVPKNKEYIPDFEKMKVAYCKIKELVDKKLILAAKCITTGGILASITKMTFGNKIGFSFFQAMDKEDLVRMDIGDIIIEAKQGLEEELATVPYKLLGVTQAASNIKIHEEIIDLEVLIDYWEKPLKNVFPIKKETLGHVETLNYVITPIKHDGGDMGAPRVFIPVFPGTNCEYDSIRAFQKSGAIVDSFVFKNLTKEDIEESISEIAKGIKKSQILMLPGGFSAGDEPDGSGKFIATVFRNPYITDATMDLLKNRDGLILGICNGFQALIKLGLVPYGEIGELSQESPTLTFNNIGRHVSCIPMTKIVSNLSPWFNGCSVGDIHRVPVSHGEGRFIATRPVLENLIRKGQIATQYVDDHGNATYDGTFNPNGSIFAVEGITSPDGRVLGKMGHSERMGEDLYKNIHGNKNQNIFEAGVKYFV
ncbi:MAG: phosphoribosylformylglycinamidine synthase [Eubacteriales bacterium]